MFGRLVRRIASRCASRRASESASRRCGRRSATLHSQLRDETAKRQLVSECSETAQHGSRRARQHRVSPLWLARENVRQMHLDERYVHGRERIANGETGMRVCTGIDQCSIGSTAHGVDAVDELAFAVMLRELDLGAKLAGNHAESLLDV